MEVISENKIIAAKAKGYVVSKDGVIVSGVEKKSLSLYKGSTGYYAFSFRFKGVRTVIPVHRLQAFQKYGEKMFAPGIVVRHKDGDPLNNHEDNILIGNQFENMQDIPPYLRMKRAMYATSFCRKYDREEVKAYHFENGSSYKKTMNNFGITSKGTLNFILKH